MSSSQILEVVIGLIVVYYILGTLVSIITKLITDTFETRGVALQYQLDKILGERAVDLTTLPQIKALQPIRYKNLLSVFSQTTEAKKVEKIPAPVLVDAFFDLTGLTGKSGLNADELTSLINQLPESEGKQAVLKWINQGVTDINDLRGRTTTYLSGALDQASAIFKANARSFVIILSIAITLFLGTDSIQLAKDLWNSAELRAVAAAQANMVIQQQGTGADIGNLINELGALSIKIGWWQPQNLPQNPGSVAWIQFILLKLLGLGLTVLAVSQGSSFWYDLLKKIVEPSSSSSSDSSG